jgi:Uncharacterized protein conserved in bacteria
MANGIKQDGRLLEIDTPLGKDELILTRLGGTEAISKIFCFNLDMYSKNNKILPKQLIGKPVSCKVNGENPRYFHGIINRFSVGLQSVRGWVGYRAEIVPWFWFLTQNIDCKIYQDKSVKEIIEDQFKAFGFSDYSIKIWAIISREIIVFNIMNQVLTFFLG